MGKEKMKMSKSAYTDYTILTNKNSGKRTHKVQAFVIHHMAAVWTGKRCAEYFRDTPSRQASANYCIGYDGDVAQNVEEEKRAWTSSSNWADQRALTYELSNSKTGHPWEVSDKTINKLILMLAEAHKKYGIKKCTYTGDTSGTLWRHDWFANTNCPGPYLGGKLSYIAKEVNKILDGGKVETPKPSKPSTSKKSNSNIAQEVYEGKWGNNPKRKRDLEKAGYNYSTIQKLVNELAKNKGKSTSKPKSNKKSNETIANEVLAGKWGDNPKRKEKLKSAGYNYDAIQKIVNQKLNKKKSTKKSVDAVAREILYGRNYGGWGTGATRKKRLKDAGYDPAAVQKRVNQLA